MIQLRDIAKTLGFEVGCGDNSCIWGPPGGMGTNGGCRCYEPRADRTIWNGLRQMAAVANKLRAAQPGVRLTDEEREALRWLAQSVSGPPWNDEQKAALAVLDKLIGEEP